MLATLREPRIEIIARNPDHHLWLNGYIWYLNCTVHPMPRTEHRLRVSLGTREVELARLRRDALFRALQAEDVLGGVVPERADDAILDHIAAERAWAPRAAAVLARVRTLRHV